MSQKSELQDLEPGCATVDDWTKLALKALEKPADEEYAAELARKAMMDCRTTEDYVNLAQFVSSHLVTNSDYLEELLEQAKDFYFEPMEYAEIGNAFSMLGNSDRGLELICKAIDTLDSDEKGDIHRLFEFAYDAGCKELAAILELEASSSPVSASDIVSLVARMSLSDVETAKAVLKRAEIYLHTISDHVSFAKAFCQAFGDQSLARRLLPQARKLLQTLSMDFSDFEDYIKLVDGLAEVLGRPKLVDDFLIPELIDDLLEEAEANNSPARLLVYLASHFELFAPDDARWAVNELHSLRAQVQLNARYEINYSHRMANAASELLQLARRVAFELDEPWYSGELIDEALAKQDEQNADISHWLKAIEIAAYYLYDADLVRKIAVKALEARQYFTNPDMLARKLGEVIENEEPQRTALIRRFLDEWQAQNSYPHLSIKMIEFVLEYVGDTEFTEHILDKVVLANFGHLQLAELGDLYQRTGNATKSLALYRSAISSCESASDLSYLMNCLRVSGISESERKSIYRESRIKMLGKLNQLRWIEGILLHFEDRKWAEEEYDDFELMEISNDAVHSMYKASRLQLLDKDSTDGPATK